MKEIGILLKEKRKENGVSLAEAAEDLQIDESALENMEEGNIRAFKDMYVLKELIKDYAKYLGVDVNDVVEEFNDFLFEHTSKISIEDIIETKKKTGIDITKKIVSPYTKIPKPKKDYKKMVKPIILVLVLFLFSILLFLFIRGDDTRSVELKSCYKEVMYYEFT